VLISTRVENGTVGVITPTALLDEADGNLASEVN
jgi:hypothetical protein